MLCPRSEWCRRRTKANECWAESKLKASLSDACPGVLRGLGTCSFRSASDSYCFVFGVLLWFLCVGILIFLRLDWCGNDMNLFFIVW